MTTVPNLWYWGFPVNRASVAFVNTSFYRLAVPVITPKELDANYQAANVVRDMSRGTLTVGVFDCLGQSAPGVQVGIDQTGAEIVQTYGFGLSMSAKQTDTTAVSYFANVQPGPVTVTATPVALGKPSGKVTVLVKAGAATGVYLNPTP
jgi:hypothetical protein